jgi:septum site-determining protein MinC
MRHLVRIKGGKDSLRVQIDDTAEWETVILALQEQLTQSSGFFSGARLVVEVGDRQLNDHQMTEILALMEQHGVRPESLAAATRESRAAARAAGITGRPMPEGALPQQATAHNNGESTLLCRTLHSGQVARHQGHITLIGDINPGAQVIAGGSVVVWGRLRGLVHAGALGDTSALVCALDLRPTQLRIANLIARAPDGERVNHPEIARIEHETIVVEAWETFKETVRRGQGI